MLGIGRCRAARLKGATDSSCGTCRTNKNGMIPRISFESRSIDSNPDGNAREGSAFDACHVLLHEVLLVEHIEKLIQN
jgi:hypothetical protein